MKKELLSLQLECMMLFQSDPLMTASVKDLEARLAVSEQELHPVLELLVKQGIISRSGEESSCLFQYQEPLTTMEVGINGKLESS